MPTAKDLDALRSGVKLDDGATAPAEIDVVGATTGDRDSRRAELRVVIREGRHRQVRRMVQAVGHKVQTLRRTGLFGLRTRRWPAPDVGSFYVRDAVPGSDGHSVKGKAYGGGRC